jgi:hypothetical protein
MLRASHNLIGAAVGIKTTGYASFHLAPSNQATSNKQRQKSSQLANSSRLEFFHGTKCKVQKVS